MKHVASVLIALLVLFGGAASADVKKQDIDIKAPDGITLKGTHFSPGKNGPGVLLLHQCNMDRHAWDGLATALGDAGFHVLTVDFRGYGDSGDKTTDATQRQAQRAKWPADVDAMLARLVALQGVDRSRLALGGASCGVRQSSDLAMRHPGVKALIELSGAAGDEGKAYVAKTPSLAIFGAAAEGDKNAAVGIRELVSASKHPSSTVKIYSGTEHGVPMLPKNPDLQPAIVSWLKAALMPGNSTN